MRGWGSNRWWEWKQGLWWGDMTLCAKWGEPGRRDCPTVEWRNEECRPIVAIAYITITDHHRHQGRRHHSNWGDNVPPNTHECGGQGGTKLLGDPILHMHKMSSSVENQTIKNENHQQMRIACLPTTTIRKATAYFLSTLYIQLSFINCHNVARVAVSSQSRWLFQWYVIGLITTATLHDSPPLSIRPLRHPWVNLLKILSPPLFMTNLRSPVKCIDFNGYRHLYD